MIPGLELILKLVGFGLDLFVRNREKREALRESFDKFFRASAKDSQVSSDLKNEHDNMRSGPWKKNETSKK
jgi:hypothetical protein